MLPPRSPKLNGCVERAQRTHREEFYQTLDPPASIEELRQKLRAWVDRDRERERMVSPLRGKTVPGVRAVAHPEFVEAHQERLHTHWSR